jgi:uncharacterized protein
VSAAASRWGWLGTVLWGLVVMAVFFATQAAFVLAYARGTMRNIRPEAMAAELAKLQANGDVVAASLFLSTPASLLAIIAVLKLKRGSSFDDALALRAPPKGALWRWMLAAIAFAAACDALTWLFGRPIVPAFMEMAYRTADGKVALWIAFVIAAPVFEEIFFRGFAITGLASSRMGAVGAVVVTALLWAAMHVQYDFYDVATLFLIGLLLGAARVKTGSVLVPLAMHMTENLIATAEAALL